MKKETKKDLRMHVRFSNENQLDVIGKAIEANNADPLNRPTNRNRFIVDATLEKARKILKGSVTFAGRTGTNMHYAIVTDNTKELKLHGTSLTWS